MNRDTLFRLATELDFLSLKNLCQNNPVYAEICREPRFQQLINNRYQEYILNKQIDQLYNLINNNNNSVTYTLIKRTGNNSKSHTIVFDKIVFDKINDYVDVNETLTLIPLTESILVAVFGINNVVRTLTTARNEVITVENIKPKEIKEILKYIITTTDFDISKFKY